MDESTKNHQKNWRRCCAALCLCAAVVTNVGCEVTGGRSRAESTTENPARSAAGLPPRPALIHHIAFFKLKDPAQADALIADCDRLLATIPGVVAYHAGKHLDTGRGERVDGNYDVGFFVGFNSREDLAAYVAHPNHIEAVNTWRPRWQWIRVHDVIDPTP